MIVHREQQDPPPAAEPTRATYLMLIGVIAIAFAGFVVGIDDGAPRPPFDPGGSARSVTSEAVPALTYAELRTTDIGPNRAWGSAMDQLALEAPSDEIPEQLLEDKLASLSLRAERRAYNGAPPVIPHRVEQLSSAACLACHEDSLRIGERRADRIPHPYMTNCQQCHVVAAAHDFDPVVLAVNTFQGKPAPTEGPRAWAEAPPVVPHTTFMRDDCLSCHGPQGKPGLLTTHPERVNCLQCHAPSAVLDQAILARGGSLLPPPRIEGP